VLAEASVRAERMTRYGLSRTTPVRLHDFGPSSAVLSRPQWVLACAIDGAASDKPYSPSSKALFSWETNGCR
jgi:hypothetical protein